MTNQIPMINRGDIVTLFGSKVKLSIKEDQDTSKKMVGINAKDKPIRFTFQQISKIVRYNKSIYQLYEE